MNQKISCSFSQDSNVYFCAIKNVIFPAHFRFYLSGDHIHGKTNLDVQKVFITSCNITRVPRGLKSLFPNMRSLHINNSQMKVIDRDDLTEYSDLKQIHFGANRINILPRDLFADFTNLEVISFWSNEIQLIEPTIFDGLQNLKYVNLQKNPMYDICYDSIRFKGNVTLEQMKIEIRMKYQKSPWKSIFEKNRKLDEKNNELMGKMKSSVNDDVNRIILNEKFKDFVVKVGDEEFKVHKFLLAARSPVLAEIIENNFDAEELNLTDISIDIFREILNFIYTDKLPTSNEIDYNYLYAAAGRLKIEKLKEFAAEMCKRQNQ